MNVRLGPSPPIRIEVGSGQAAAVGGIVRLPRRELEILSAIALERGVSTERLVDLVWTDEDGRRARASFKVLVSRLRRRVGRWDVVTLHGHRWALGSNVLVDVLDWDALAQEALRGSLDAALRHRLTEALSALMLGPAPVLAYSELATRIGSVFDRILTCIAQRLIDDAFGRCDAAGILAVAGPLAARDPYSEAWLEATMKAYLLMGNEAAASDALRVHERFLRAEGMNASPRLRGILHARGVAS